MMGRNRKTDWKGCGCPCKGPVLQPEVVKGLRQGRVRSRTVEARLGWGQNRSTPQATLRVWALLFKAVPCDLTSMWSLLNKIAETEAWTRGADGQLSGVQGRLGERG